VPTSADHRDAARIAAAAGRLLMDLRARAAAGDAEMAIGQLRDAGDREANALIVTRGEQGSSVFTARGGRIDVPAVAPRRVVDPTGVGDAFRGGLMKGMALGVPYETAARIGSVAATYALEHLQFHGSLLESRCMRNWVGMTARKNINGAFRRIHRHV